MVQLTAPSLTGSDSTDPIVLSGVSAVKWNIEHKMETNYGLGGQPVSRGFGNTVYTASITMDYNTQVQLRALQGSLMNLGEFDLVISFANDLGSDNWVEETITLQGCVFNEDGMEVSQDDTNITKEFNLNPFKIVLSTSAA